MKNIFEKETPKLTSQLSSFIQISIEDFENSFITTSEDEPVAIAFGKAVFINIPIEYIAISDKIEMLGRKMVDKFSINYDPLYMGPIIACYWESQNILIHIDGWHRLKYASLHPELFPNGIIANVINPEKIKQKKLSEDEIIEVVANLFLKQKDACLQLKAIDSFYPELYCSDVKKRNIAKAVKAVEEIGFTIAAKGTPKNQKSGLLPFTLLKEIASIHGVLGTQFAARAVHSATTIGNDEMRTVKKFLTLAKTTRWYDEESLTRYAETLSLRLSGKRMKDVFVQKRSTENYQDAASKQMFRDFKAFQKERCGK